MVFNKCQEYLVGIIRTAVEILDAAIAGTRQMVTRFAPRHRRTQDAGSKSEPGPPGTRLRDVSGRGPSNWAMSSVWAIGCGRNYKTWN